MATASPDLLVTNYFGESTTFYRNLGHGFFADHSAAVGLAAPTRGLLGFGISFLDVNQRRLARRPDAPMATCSTLGHASPGRCRSSSCWADPRGGLTDVSAGAGAPFGRLHLGRGLAVGDLDNDGRLDALIVAQNEPLVYLHNETSPTGHFVRFQLEGTRSNRDAIGARSHGHLRGRKLVAQRVGGSSYLSISGSPNSLRPWQSAPGSMSSRSAGPPGMSIATPICSRIGNTSFVKGRILPCCSASPATERLLVSLEHHWLQPQVELVLLQVPDEHIGDREEEGQAHQAVPEWRVAGHDRADRLLDRWWMMYAASGFWPSVRKTPICIPPRSQSRMNRA